jgi:hypothetical protein
MVNEDTRSDTKYYPMVAGILGRRLSEIATIPL